MRCRVIELSGEVITWDSVEEILTEIEERHPEYFAQLEVPVTPEGEPISDGSGETTFCGTGALNGELEKLSAAPQGDRNNQLNHSAFRVFQLDGHVNFVEADSTLFAKGAEIGLGPAEIRATLRSAIWTTRGVVKPIGLSFRTGRPPEVADIPTLALARFIPDRLISRERRALQCSQRIRSAGCSGCRRMFNMWAGGTVAHGLASASAPR